MDNEIERKHNNERSNMEEIIHVWFVENWTNILDQHLYKYRFVGKVLSKLFLSQCIENYHNC